jgi:hypothetical protein
MLKPAGHTPATGVASRVPRKSRAQSAWLPTASQDRSPNSIVFSGKGVAPQRDRGSLFAALRLN